MPSRVTRSQARKGVGDPTGTNEPPPPEGTSKRPTKRTKTSKHPKKVVPAQRSRKKGRLSVLPTLPLDVLFEIFTHLGPADLLHLSRTTKAFRAVLLSRQSAFLWNTVCDGVNEMERFPCPEGVSLPVWANLAYGGPWCDADGCQARAHKVLWNLRRRLCKSCATEVLVDALEAYDILDDYCLLMTVELCDILPCDYTSRGHSNKTPLLYSLSEVQAYAHEIEELSQIYRMTQPLGFGSADNAGFDRALADLHERKAASLVARKAHARACEDAERIRSEMRLDELWKIKEDRFHEIKTRLMAMGVDEVDAHSPLMRAHKEVNKSQPLTERVWTRIRPILRSEATRIRDRRLAQEQLDRLEIRQLAIREEYECEALQRVAPSMLCYVPNASVIYKIPQVADYLAEDILPENPASRLSTQAVCTILREGVVGHINEWVSRRHSAMREALPGAWPRSSFTNEDVAAHWPPPTNDPPYDRYSEIADLDLAVYTFKCSSPSCVGARIFYGLDILAHDCLHPDASTATVVELDEKPIDYSLHAQPLTSSHLAATRIVELLGMDPTKTRPIELDKASRIFTVDHYQSGAGGRPFMTWRQAVAACAPQATGAEPVNPAALRLATEREKVFVETRHHALYGALPMLEPDEDAAWWGCAHCSSFVKDMGFNETCWMYVDELQYHLQARHNIEPQAAKEGDNYFYNRVQERDSHVEDGVAISFLEEGEDIEDQILFYEGFGDVFHEMGFFGQDEDPPDGAAGAFQFIDEDDEEDGDVFFAGELGDL
ncbi:unnamed protein product [Peniophora sp. CBMAI 1063]|nr:unnamed protein product [Peniophora sp. CBMAI 1063]